MSLQKNRTRIWVRGLGNLEVRQIEPSPVDPAFLSVGYIQSTTISDEFEMEDITPETGRVIDYLPKQRVVGGVSQLMQTSINEINLLTSADDVNKIYAVRYYGPVEGDPSGIWQYFLFNQCRLKPGLNPLAFGPTQRSLPCAWRALYDDSAGYAIPEYTVIQTDGPIAMVDLQPWIAPRLELNLNTTRVLDISGFARHGLLQQTDSAHASPSSMWGTADPAAPIILAFNGTNDNINFGNVCDIGNEDFMIEFWVKIMAADGTIQEILSKKTSNAAGTPGFYVERSAANGMKCYFSDGTDQATPITANGTVLTAVWNHFAVTAKRSTVTQCYLNGAVSGSSVSMTSPSIETMTNAVSLYLGRIGTNYGQLRIGMFRIYRYAAGLPSDIATQIANHYSGEKGYFGL